MRLTLQAATTERAEEWHSALIGAGWTIAGDPTWCGPTSHSVSPQRSTLSMSGELNVRYSDGRWQELNICTLTTDGLLRLQRTFGRGGTHATPSRSTAWCAEGDGFAVGPATAVLGHPGRASREITILHQPSSVVRSARSVPLQRAAVTRDGVYSPATSALARERNAVRHQRRQLGGSPSRRAESARLASLRAQSAMLSIERAQRRAADRAATMAVDEGSLGRSCEAEPAAALVRDSIDSDDSLSQGGASSLVFAAERARGLEAALAASQAQLAALERASSTRIALLEADNAALAASLRAAELGARNAALEFELRSSAAAAAAVSAVASMVAEAAAREAAARSGYAKVAPPTAKEKQKRFSLRRLLSRRSAGAGDCGVGGTVNPAFNALAAPPVSLPLEAPPPVPPLSPPPLTTPAPVEPTIGTRVAVDPALGRDRMVARVRAASLLKRRLQKLRAQRELDEHAERTRLREKRWHEARRPRPKATVGGARALRNS